MKNLPMIFEVVQIEAEPHKKNPLFLEIPVPEKTFPYLIGNPKKDAPILRWIEQPSTRGTVLSWGLSSSIEEIVACMVSLVLERDKTDKWDCSHIHIEQAQARMAQVGITETRLVENMLVPKDPSLLGTIILMNGRKFPVIHNPSRGFCLLSQKEI
jgi:hypothetical protein